MEDLDGNTRGRGIGFSLGSASMSMEYEVWGMGYLLYSVPLIECSMYSVHTVHRISYQNGFNTIRWVAMRQVPFVPEYISLEIYYIQS